MAGEEVSGTQQPAPTAGTTQAAGTEGAQKPAGEASGNYTSSSTISSMADFKNKAPEVYEGMLKGIAQTIISQMHSHIERWKKIMDEFEKTSKK